MSTKKLLFHGVAVKMVVLPSIVLLSAEYVLTAF